MGDRMFASEGDSVNVGRQGSAVWGDRWDDAPHLPAGAEAAAAVVRRLQARLDRHLWLLERLRADQSYPEPPGFAELAESGRRMRRDTESLLVLGDQESGVRSGAPPRLPDIVAEAGGSAEEPGRVDVRPAPAATIAPAAAAEFLHVLGELLDEVTSAYPAARLDVATRVEGRGIVVDVSVGAGAHLALDGMSGDAVAVVAEQIAARSRHGITLSRPLAGPPRSGPGPVASVHCPPAAVTLDEPRPILSDPFLPTRNGSSPGREPHTTGNEPQHPAENPLGMRDDPRPFGDDPLGLGSDLRTAGNEPQRPAGDSFSFGDDPLRLGDDPLGLGRDPRSMGGELQRPDESLSLADDPLGLGGESVRGSDDALQLGDDPLGLGDNPVRGEDDAVGQQDDPFQPRNGSSQFGSYQPVNGSAAPANGAVFPGEASDRPVNGAGYPRPAAPKPKEPAYPSPPRASSDQVDELFGPLLDLPLEPIDDRYATPIFEAIASAWFQDPESEPADERSGGPGNDAPPLDWETPNDNEWRAAAALAARPEATSETTSSGLPRRRPGNQLVPPPRAQDSNPVAERIPDRVRERLATYQRGLRQGRHRAPGAEDPGAL